MAPFKPMLLTLAQELPTGPGVVFEPKIDGFRAVVTIRDLSVRIISRHGVDWTSSFPELADLGCLTHDAVLDGELAVLDEAGKADFGLLQDRLGFRALARTHARWHPAMYYVFDIIEHGAV